MAARSRLRREDDSVQLQSIPRITCSSFILHLAKAMPRSKSHVYDATKPTPIFSLPQEILLDVLLLVQPHDLSAFSQTCSKASHLVTDSSYLWRGMYLKAWDPTISSVNALPVLSADQPRPIRNPYSHKGKGKAKEHQDPPPATTTSITPSLQTLVKQRTKARLNLRRGSYDPHYLVGGVQ